MTFLCYEACYRFKILLPIKFTLIIPFQVNIFYSDARFFLALLCWSNLHSHRKKKKITPVSPNQTASCRQPTATVAFESESTPGHSLYSTVSHVKTQGTAIMPPTRGSSFLSTNIQPNGIATRAKRGTVLGLRENQMVGKRKADSPLKKATTKRSAFGDITNAIGKSANDTKNVLKNVTNAKAFSKFKDKKTVEKKEIPVKGEEKKEVTVKLPSLKAVDKPLRSGAPTRKTLARISSTSSSQPVTRKTATVVEPVVATVQKPKPPAAAVATAVKPVSKEPVRSSARLSARHSLTNDSGETSLYVSALDINPDDASNQGCDEVTDKSKQSPPKRKLPPGVEDFDAENTSDPFAVSDYAMDIFDYLKSREPRYKIEDYMDKQVDLTRYMRALLVDWMVEVQENFELNHETLYLGVKIVDTYLSKVPVGKQTLQLVGAAAMFIAGKFDERVPPLVEDLTYICDGAYTYDELISMEVNILRVLGFDLAMPLSYRFLRRYARCAKIAMPQLTLARYILEVSLLEYNYVTVSDSKLAAAALLLSLRMQDLGSWTPTLEYYSGYKLEDIHGLCYQLNETLHKKFKTAIQTVRNKYSHKVFFEVANIPLLDDLKL